MSRPLLLFLDGQTLKVPGLEEALARGGWDLETLPSNAAASRASNREIAIILLDPKSSGPAGFQAVQTLRNVTPDLPVVLLQAASDSQITRSIAGLAGQLERTLSPHLWVSVLNGILASLRAEKHKFTAEDLFADILADLDGEQKQKSTASVPPPPQPPSLPASHDDWLESLPGGAKDPLRASGGMPTPPISPQAPAEITFKAAGVEPVRDFEAIKSPGEASLDDYRFAESSIPGLTDNGKSKPSIRYHGEPAAGEYIEEFGNYYLLEKIAVGGMAELFKARQRGVHNFEKIVAIKRILPHLSDNDEFVRMFIDEAKLAAQLTHPNIVQIFDLGKAAGSYYIAMEYVDGKDLRSLLRKVREFQLPFPEVVAAAITMKIAGALDYAHRKKGMNDRELKLVHRDISPQNVLLSSEGAVKLVDFGIAKAATKSTQTIAGALKGKLLYMSPEQALGEPLDCRSDIYSLGLVLFELLTGMRCFQADSELGVLEKVRMGKVQDIQQVNPKISREMATVVHRALQKDVDRRYPSARLLERDLKSLLSREGTEPVEHDIAEFANVLLNGTKEQVEMLIASHFPQRPPSPGTDGQLFSMDESPLPDSPVTAPPSVTPAGEQPSWVVQEGLPASESKKSRLLPIIAIIMATIAILLWLFTRLRG